MGIGEPVIQMSMIAGIRVIEPCARTATRRAILGDVGWVRTEVNPMLLTTALVEPLRNFQSD